MLLPLLSAKRFKTFMNKIDSPTKSEFFNRFKGAQY